METAVKRLYEGMFLVDSALAAQDWQKVLDELQRILDRAEAEVVSQKKWDERRLSYDIQGKSRGTYILIYFNCDTEKVKGIERDVQLSELIVRTLILRTERMSTEDIEKLTPLEAEAAIEEQKQTPENVETADTDDAPKSEAPTEAVPAEAAVEAEANDEEPTPETPEKE